MLITFLVYILGMVLIGFIAYRATVTLTTTFSAAAASGAATALSAGASDMSGWLLMGLPGAVFIGGISELDRHRPHHRRLPQLALVAGRLRFTEKNRNA